MAARYLSFVDPRQQHLNLRELTGVYCITDTRNGMRYVGSTTESFHRRWNGHCAEWHRNDHGNGRLQAIWNKHGSVFVFSVLRICPPDECLRWEQEFMNHFQSANKDHGYNLSPTAGNTRGVFPSAETRAKLSAAMKKQNRTMTPEHIAFMQQRRREWEATHKRAPATEEHRRNLSKALKGRTFTDEAKAKMSAAKIGRPLTPEHIANNAASRRGRKASAEHCANMSRGMTGRKFSAEHRAKIAAYRSGKKATVETRHRISESLKKREFTPEHRARISAATAGVPKRPRSRKPLPNAPVLPWFENDVE